MTLWIIEPHDSLVFRDSRPFHATPGAKANTLPFPFPSTLAGAVRTQAGLDENGVFTLGENQLDALKKLQVRGPFLAQLKSDGSIEHLLLSAPLDALVLSSKTGKNKARLSRLLPLALPAEAQTDLVSAGDTEQDQPPYLVGQPIHNPEKPMQNPPTYWYWSSLEHWLLQDDDPEKPEAQPREVKWAELGHRGPQRETRIHIRMDAKQHVAADGALFETVGLEFIALQKSVQTSNEQELREDDDEEKLGLHEARRLALVVEVDEDKFQVREGLSYLGGERRIVNWCKSQEPLSLYSDASIEKIMRKIVDSKASHKACRLILLTPAYFEQGYLPQWFIEDALTRYKLNIHLDAIAIQRPQVVSGWDMQARKPKQSRRLAPAGTVLFLKFPDDASAQAIERWVRDMWLRSISDDEQGRYDGEGIAIFGTWSGKAVPASAQKIKEEEVAP